MTADVLFISKLVIQLKHTVSLYMDISRGILLRMRKLDDIIPPSRRREALEQQSMQPAMGAPREPLRLSPRPSRFPYATLGGILLVILVSVGALFYFSSAQVEVTPNSVSTAVQSSFTADRSSGTLPFEVLTAKKVATQSVQGNGTKTVTASASGTLTVYNTQSKAQKLVANTRFATTAGLIFRTHVSITVPAGSASKPGSVDAKVFADQAGDTYNVGPSSFTLPGLAGSPLATEVYARSTSPMTGGASGTIPVVDSATESTATKALTAALGPDLLKSIQSQVPAGYVLLPGAASTSFVELTPAPSSSTGMVDVKEEGTVTAVVFPSSALAGAIASSVSGLGYQGEPLTLTSYGSLTLSPVAGVPDPSATTFAFSLSGTAGLTYTVDSSRISAAVAGKTRSAAEVALTNYPEVKRAILILRPFWRQSFPEDPTSIKVSVLNAAE